MNCYRAPIMKPIPGRCGARLKNGDFCRLRPLRGGNGRCGYHSGHSTGPISDAGKARASAAGVAGRHAWVADMRASIAAGEIDRFPCGRRAGGRNRTLEERAQAAHEQQCERGYRRIQRQARADRRARKQELAELDRRREQFHAGLPFWDDAADLVASDPGLTLKMEACFEAALTFFRDHGGAGRKAERDLARDERTFIKFLNSPTPPPHEAIEKVYDRLTRCEEAFGPTDGKATRLEHLQREYDNYLRRRAVDAAVKQVAMARAAAVTERAPVAVAPPISQTALGNQTSAPGSQTAGTPSTDSEPNCPPHQCELQRAYELSKRISRIRILINYRAISIAYEKRSPTHRISG